MLTTNQKGLIAETAIIHECAKLGVGVARPLDDERYDLIFDVGKRLLRVQCKWATRRGGIVVVPLFSCRRAPEGLRRMPYSRADVDAFAAYSPDADRCYFFEFAEIQVTNAVQLRLAPTRNNQARGIRWATDYDLGARLRALLGP